MRISITESGDFMGFRFRKSIKAGPVRVNLSKSGIGFSAGVKGAKITKPAKGKARTTVGIPGTGLSYSKTVGGKKKTAAKKTAPKNTDPKKRQPSTTSELTAEDCEKGMGCLSSAARWVFLLIMLIPLFTTWPSVRALFPILTILVALPVRAWQELLTERLHIPLASKLISGVAFVLATMFFKKPAILALSGLLFVLAVLLAVMKAKKDAPADQDADTEKSDAVEKPEVAEPAEKQAEPETVVRSYRVAGVPYYLDNLLSMAEPNYLYDYKKQELIDTCHADETIYKQTYGARHLDLTHEPDNPHDPNAIKVLLDNKLVGYIAAQDCQHILDIMDNDLFVSATCEIKGGKYKRVNEDYDCIKDKSTYKMETGEDDYGIDIYIREKVM